MYLPAAFEETRPEALSQLIADHPLGTLVTLGPDGLEIEVTRLVGKSKLGQNKEARRPRLD